MQKLDLFEMYEFGKHISQISKIDPDENLGPNIFPLVMARLRLERYTAPGTPLLNSSVRAARSLITSITAVVPEDLESAFATDGGKKIGWSATAVKKAAEVLESVLRNDMPDISSYVVSQKGIFRTDDLIQHAEHQLSNAALKHISARAIQDLREAGRCLAYELPVACAFHLWRTVETVMGDYYTALTAKTFEQAKVTRNWYEKIQALTAANADIKITAFLDHLRSAYRNPQTHPDEEVPLEEAQRLFSVATSSIEQMLIATGELTKMPENALIKVLKTPDRKVVMVASPQPEQSAP